VPKSSQHLLPSVEGIRHRRQQQVADCLAACAAMVLDYLGLSISYEKLLGILSIGPYGTPRSSILHLESLGVRVAYREAALDILAEYLRAG
jgi:ABC-type bacteriocin/lantibiotic exporter with double-glycine peptidase domain